jgi:Zn-dependent M16 (insulinase) family peptidase
MPALLRLCAALASLAAAAGPADLASLRPDQAVAGGFRVQALYLDPSGSPKGARFVHERGALVDVLFFDSVPQISVAFRTPPDDERGAPHALEHLLMGKGATGRRLRTLIPMRMGQQTAGTSADLTCFQFSSAAGPAEFYELLGAFLDALIRPDFTDEEVRREVAHTVALEQDGRLKLEEAGTVYNEMVSRMEQPDSVYWDQMGRMLYGPEHPLARNNGGEPEELWKLSPASIRAFHAAHYHLDGGMEMIAALPMDWSADDFLSRLDAAIRRLEPQASSRPAAGLPPFTPLAERAVRIGSFPSRDRTAPQDVLMAWPPVRTFSVAEQVRLDLALDILGGDLSYLSRDLVDEGTRKLDSGATNVSMGAQVLPASYASFEVYGLPRTSLTPQTLARLRDVVMERVRWMHDLKPGAADLAEIADKARARIRSRRRATLKSLDGPPRFGEGVGEPDWHRSLDQLAAEPGFAKSLGEDAALERLGSELAAGGNPWAAALERAGLLQPPYVSAALPDFELLQRQKRRKEERLQARTLQMEAATGLAEAPALERYRAETASASAVLETLERGADQPSFLREPPLELDRIDWSEGRLPCGPRLVSTRFATAFTDISIAFDLGGISEADQELLPLLAIAVRGVGVLTRSGDRVDYAKAKERILADIQGADVEVEADARGERTELVFTGRASAPEEIPAAVQWIENYMLRPDLSGQSRQGLIGWITASIQSQRGLFQQDEASWIESAAAAYRYQDRPLYMHAASPFTMLRDLNRLRWRLEEPSPAQLAVIRSTAAAALAAADAPDRPAAAQRLEAVSGEFGEYLRWELSHLPEDSWRPDLRALIADYLGDLGRCDETIRRLQALTRKVLVRAGARVHINGRAANIELAARQVDALLARLPQGRRPPPPRRRGLVLARLRERFPGLALPAHVALVDESGKTGAISVTAAAAGYRTRRRSELLDALALGTLAGGGAHTLFMRTWDAGLAYSSGITADAARGVVSYYADKCPDPAQTLRFVDDVAASFRLEDPSLLEYSLANAFGDYRAGRDFSSRGEALADDLEAGDRPETVRGYKTALLRLAREPGALAAVGSRLQPALGRLLVGLRAGKVSATPGATAFFVGPEELIRRYEDFVRERGEASRVIRLYPRDFWP